MSKNGRSPSQLRYEAKRWEIANPGHRTWQCRGCGKVEYGNVPPHRWYRLQRCSGDEALGHAQLGVCCSVACLRRHVDGVVAQQEPATPAFPSWRRQEPRLPDSHNGHLRNATPGEQV